MLKGYRDNLLACNHAFDSPLALGCVCMAVHVLIHPYSTSLGIAKDEETYKSVDNYWELFEIQAPEQLV